VSVDFTAPTFTRAAAVICRVDSLLKAAASRLAEDQFRLILDAFYSGWGRSDKVRKAGCEEWRDGIRVYGAGPMALSPGFTSFATTPDGPSEYFTIERQLRNGTGDDRGARDELVPVLAGVVPADDGSLQTVILTSHKGDLLNYCTGGKLGILQTAGQKANPTGCWIEGQIAGSPAVIVFRYFDLLTGVVRSFMVDRSSLSSHLYDSRTQYLAPNEKSSFSAPSAVPLTSLASQLTSAQPSNAELRGVETASNPRQWVEPLPASSPEDGSALENQR
jgi:hypothetical protein